MAVIKWGFEVKNNNKKKKNIWNCCCIHLLSCSKVLEVLDAPFQSYGSFYPWDLLILIQKLKRYRKVR